MNRKEKVNLVLEKVPEEKRDEFVVELRAAETKEARSEVLKKYNAKLTEEEIAIFHETSNELSDEELDQASGGCCGHDTGRSSCGCSSS